MTSRDSDAVFVETNAAAQYGSICTKIKIVLCLIHLLEMVLQYEGLTRFKIVYFDEFMCEKKLQASYFKL